MQSLNTEPANICTFLVDYTNTSPLPLIILVNFENSIVSILMLIITVIKNSYCLIELISTVLTYIFDIEILNTLEQLLISLTPKPRHLNGFQNYHKHLLKETKKYIIFYIYFIFYITYISKSFLCSYH